ncbi:transcription activator BRG1-like [Uloborus diversus]|uniref:transcription activator BRG1-like n=1 Tax=Uloborus diversus TaxID=327109 RepID=UPI00240A10A8|nr:transcription activator BRG1-like [Uloborus diversus]
MEPHEMEVSHGCDSPPQQSQTPPSPHAAIGNAPPPQPENQTPSNQNYQIMPQHTGPPPSTTNSNSHYILPSQNNVMMATQIGPYPHINAPHQTAQRSTSHGGQNHTEPAPAPVPQNMDSTEQPHHPHSNYLPGSIYSSSGSPNPERSCVLPSVFSPMTTQGGSNPPSQKPSLLTQAQKNQLRAQMIADELLSRNQLVPEHIIMVMQGKRSMQNQAMCSLRPSDAPSPVQSIRESGPQSQSSSQNMSGRTMTQQMPPFQPQQAAAASAASQHPPLNNAPENSNIPPSVRSPMPTQGGSGLPSQKLSLTQAQTNQLWAQIMAFNLLATNQPVPEHIMALQGKCPIQVK